MRCTNTFILATGVSIPPSVPIDAVMDDGRYDAAHAAKTRQLAVALAEGKEQAPDLALAAARQVLERAGHDPSAVGSLFHAVILHNGVDAWNCGSYLQRELGLSYPGCFVLEVRSGCAAGLAGLEVACSYIETHGKPATALLTAAERYTPTVDRWKVPGTVLADGASSILVSQEQPGFAQILSIRTISDPSMEGIERGDDPFQPFAHTPANPIRMDHRFRAFLRIMPMREILRRRQSGLRAAVAGALRDAEVDMARIKHVVYPFVGYAALAAGCLDALDIPAEDTLWDYGRTIGHMGAADAFAGLDHLVTSGRLAVGDVALLIGSGAGCTWTVAVIQARQPSP
jgi:3-oxoacyl-[acyl-carrier-protein] synthase-3